MADRLEIESVQALARFRVFLVRLQERCELLLDRAQCEIDREREQAREEVSRWRSRTEEAQQRLHLSHSSGLATPSGHPSPGWVESSSQELARCEQSLWEAESILRSVTFQEECSQAELARARSSVASTCARGVVYLDRVGGLLEEYKQIVVNELGPPFTGRAIHWASEQEETWRAFNGPLFVGPPCAEQVRQSEIGDCYLLAPLMALAHQHPHLVRSAIRRNPDGTFVVRLFEEQPDGSYEPVVVTIDNTLPVDPATGALKYARTESGNSGALWASVLEKAFAAFHGGYKHIGNGGRSENGFAMLTGTKATTRKVKNRRIWSELRDQLSHGAIACGMKHGEKGHVPGRHVYAILSVDDDRGGRTVTLRNPWGKSDHESGCGATFTMDLADFCREFDEVSLVNPSEDRKS